MVVLREETYLRYYIYFGPSPFYEGSRLAGVEKGLATNLGMWRSGSEERGEHTHIY